MEAEDPGARRSRRRASRATGPAGGASDSAVTTARVAVPATVTARVARPAGSPPRRPANREQVGLAALGAVLVAMAVLGGLLAVGVVQQRHTEGVQAREQRFVDTGAQAVVNMFSYTLDNVDESVDRFIGGTSGPLRDTMSQNVENLKAIFRATNASSETVINGAALEDIDEEVHRASVLVAARVTATDIDGVNRPSKPYRLRMIVQEDDSGQMSAYDLKWPDGGN